MALKPYKQPPDGEELVEPNGSFSGQTLYVPGPYKLPGQSIGSDSPPTANGVFNNNQTYTGCAIDGHRNIFGNDIATAQGDFPPPSSGRLVEWFAPNYTTDCIVYGPDAGGAGPHHTDGTGGLAQPGTMAVAPDGDLLIPNVGTSSVLRVAHVVAPDQRVAVSGRGVPAHQVQVSTFFKVSFPAGIARGPDVWLLRGQQLHRRSLHRLGERQRATRTRAGLRARHHGGRPREERRASTTRSAWPSPRTGRCTSSTSTSRAPARSPAADRPTTGAG